MCNETSLKNYGHITFFMFKQILTASGGNFREPLLPIFLFQIIKILFSISNAFFISLSRFPYHILQSTHRTQLDGRCSVYCIIWSKRWCHKVASRYHDVLLHCDQNSCNALLVIMCACTNGACSLCYAATHLNIVTRVHAQIRTMYKYIILQRYLAVRHDTVTIYEKLKRNLKKNLLLKRKSVVR